MPSGGNFTACNCGPDAAACESPTQPVATVGLCLADGRPIAVTVVRDCAGTITSEGWIDLTSGAWTPGAVPAGATACSDGRSITTNGTFCDVAEDGTTVGLVLVEYQYGADGGIDSVRLVDAVTGTTYTPQGEVTVCPSGSGQPERDLAQLCDVADDGTVTPFVRDYARGETGLIAGHADFTLDGEPYTPAGTVGLCQNDGVDCETHILCEHDGTAAAAALTVTGTTNDTQKAGTLDNGVSWTSNANRATADPEGWWTLATYPNSAVGPITFDFDHPVSATWSARIGLRNALTGMGVIMPEGTVPVEIHPLHAWDETTRTLSPLAGANADDAAQTSTFSHPGPITHLEFSAPAGGLPILRRVGDISVAPLTSTFLRTVCTDRTGEHVSTRDTLLDGTTPFTPVGDVGVCGAQTGTESCAAAVTVLRLCDLDPDVEPDADGKRCATPFLRHLAYDCDGAVTRSTDTAPDGVTPYTPVQVVDCGSGGVPAMVEVPWEVVDIAPDPESAQGRGLIFTLSPIDDPDTVGTVTVTTSSSYGTSSCPADPPAYAYRNPTQYTFRPDQALRDAATYVRCDLIDFDTFEPVTGLNPPPDRLGGTAYWDGTTVRPTDSNQTGEMYYDGPPEVWTYRVGNTGGGNSCSMLSFAAVSLRPEGCCAPCGSSGDGGEGGGRTVQEVCVIANASPDDVMHWTRVIEDGGATIYYLDQDGARYDNTLPAGHQIVACPAEESEPCRDVTSVLLCDVPSAEETGGPTTPTDTTPIEHTTTIIPLEGGAPALWSGGSVVFPADLDASETDGQQVYRTAAAALQADRPACDDGTARVTASVHVHLDGPAPGVGTTGRLALYEAGTLVGVVGIPTSPPVGYDGTLTLTKTVAAAAVAAGDVTVELRLETYHSGGKAWTVDGFTSSAEFAVTDCETQFLRKLVTDCETGEIVSVTDTTLDGTPYTVTGDVGQCTPAAAPEPEGGPDCQSCETLTLCDVQGEAAPGEGEQLPWSVTAVEPDPESEPGRGFLFRLSPAGDPSVVGTVRVTSNTVANSSCTPDGPFDLSFNNANDLVFELDDIAQGMSFIRVDLGDFDTFEPVSIHSDSPEPTRLGGTAVWNDEHTRIVPSEGGQTGEMYWDSPPARFGYRIGNTGGGGSCSTLNFAGVTVVPPPAAGTGIPFARTICRDCDGQVVSVTDTELDGETLYEPTGDVTACGAGGGSVPAEPEQRVDVETQRMCVIDNATGRSIGDVVVEIRYDTATGERVGVDYVDPLTWGPVPLPGGTHLGMCPDADPAPAVNVVQLCDLADDADPVPFLRHLVYTPGDTAPDITDTTLDGVTPYTLTGTAGVCGEPCPVQAVLEECRWDDTDGDGVGDTAYVELLAVDCEGELTSIGTYADGLTGPYTPTSPVADGPVEPAAPVVLVEPHRIELAAGATWDAATVTLLQSVTATAHGGTGSITTSDGESTLHDGESVTWSVARDDDAALTGPLAISSTTGTVTVAYTRATS
ncbi:hypothetical protein [Streptomyces sp. NPDC004763]